MGKEPVVVVATTIPPISFIGYYVDGTCKKLLHINGNHNWTNSKKKSFFVGFCCCCCLPPSFALFRFRLHCVYAVETLFDSGFALKSTNVMDQLMAFKWFRCLTYVKCCSIFFLVFGHLGIIGIIIIRKDITGNASFELVQTETLKTG